MKKIISLFVRDKQNPKYVTREVAPGAEWVIAGEGIATRKYDGTCCMVLDMKLYKRYDGSKSKHLPANFVPAYQESDRATDPNATHWLGWLPVGDGPEDRYAVEAWKRDSPLADGTYELCGPKVQSNPEGKERHHLLKHGQEILPDCPRTFDELKTYLDGRGIEGVVWHHPDGRMVKIKARDFGVNRTIHV
jgi:hypothetical protein